MAQDFYKWTEQNLEEMDSTLAVQQYIQQMIRKDHTNIEGILQMPVGQEEGVWKYEQLRQFCLELNGIAVRLQDECKPSQCWQMTATDQWIFLCAAHKTPKECSAIDYTRHTLDGAACLLNSQKYFPSRVSIKDSSVNKLGSVCRRVYRIFSHAYYHHRPIFDEAENETFLCRRFTSFVTKYDLMSRENLIVPIFAATDSSDGDDDITTTMQRNSDKRSSMVEKNSPGTFTILQNPKHAKNNNISSDDDGTGDHVAPFGIATILNLPPGVGPEDDDDESNELSDFNFLKNMAGGMDGNGIDDEEVDFSFTSPLMSSGTDFGTMKPMKKSSQKQKAVVDDEDDNSHVSAVDDFDSADGSNSFVDNDANKTVLTLEEASESHKCVAEDESEC